jgi:hypothetical protein
MDKKLIIGVLVGALLVFVWQTLSWTMLNLHGSSQKYTPNQDSILEMLGTQLDEGSYFLPTYKPGATDAEMEAAMTGSMGKPWAQISYHKEMKMNMGMNMFRGFVVDLFAVFLLCWLLMKIPGLDMKTTIMSSVAVGVIGYLTTEYTNSIWFETNSIPDLVDAVISWGLCGTWLGYWLNKK